MADHSSKKPGLLRRLFRNRPGIYGVLVNPGIGESWIRHKQALGVNLHPLARQFDFDPPEPVQDAMKQMKAEQADPKRKPKWLRPLIFVGDDLLDGRRRLYVHRKLNHSAEEIPRISVTSDEALVTYLRNNVATHRTAARRAALGLLATLLHTADYATFVERLFPGQAVLRRPQVLERFSSVCGVRVRTMQKAIACASNPHHFHEFREVCEGTRRAFPKAKPQPPSARFSARRRTQLRHRLLSKTEADRRRRPAIEADLLFLSPAAVIDDPSQLTPAILDPAIGILCSELPRTISELADEAFVCLLLPPLIVTAPSFGAVASALTKNGLNTRCTSCLVVNQASKGRSQIVPGWQLVWILSRNAHTALNAEFSDALTTHPRVPSERRYFHHLSKIIRSFCPRDGTIYAEVFDVEVVSGLIQAIEKTGVRLILPDEMHNWVRNHFQLSRPFDR